MSTPPDPDQMASDALVTSAVAGVAFLLSTVVFGVFGGVGIMLGNSVGADPTVKMVLVGLGFAVGALVLALSLRNFRGALERRGRPWYRGAIIGAVLSLAIIVTMYYFPQVAFPDYCPPGGICELNNP